MSVTPIAAIGASVVPAVLSGADSAAPPTFDVVPGLGELRTSPASGAGGAFQSILSGLNALNRELLQGDQAVRNLALGNTDNLHQSMMSLEHARLSLELMLQVRSGLLDAYQSIMRMQA